MDCVNQYGVVVLAIIHPTPVSGYEIIVVHWNKLVSEQTGLRDMPMVRTDNEGFFQ